MVCGMPSANWITLVKAEQEPARYGSLLWSRVEPEKEPVSQWLETTEPVLSETTSACSGPVLSEPAEFVLHWWPEALKRFYWFWSGFSSDLGMVSEPEPLEWRMVWSLKSQNWVCDPSDGILQQPYWKALLGRTGQMFKISVQTLRNQNLNVRLLFLAAPWVLMTFSLLIFHLLTFLVPPLSGSGPVQVTDII